MNQTETTQPMEAYAEEGETVEDKVRAELMWEAYHEALIEEEKKVVILPCPRCGSINGQWRGYREHKQEGPTHRRRCNNCGRWHQQNHTTQR